MKKCGHLVCKMMRMIVCVLIAKVACKNPIGTFEYDVCLLICCKMILNTSFTWP